MINLFLPETVLIVLCFILLCFSLAKKEITAEFLNSFMVFSGIVLLAGCFFSLKESGCLFFSTYRVDFLSQGFKCLLSLAFLFTLFFSRDILSISKNRRVEYFLFLCTATLGMMMITSAVDVLTLYLSL